MIINKILLWLADFFLNLQLGYEKRRAERLLGVARSPLWSKTKREFAKIHPKICPVCGTTKTIELHHKIPFHKNQSLENDFNNLMWLCRIHHYEWGHYFNWSSWNVDVVKDTQNFAKKVKNRP